MRTLAFGLYAALLILAAVLVAVITIPDVVGPTLKGLAQTLR